MPEIFNSQSDQMTFFLRKIQHGFGVGDLSPTDQLNSQSAEPPTYEPPEALGNLFLHQRNPKFHASLEVEAVVSYLRANKEPIPDEPVAKLSAYLGFLANQDCGNDGILTGDQSSIDRQIENHVIKPDDVPEGYFELQRRIAREQGHGDIEITPEIRQEAARIISADQRHSLKPWGKYLSGEDANYPNWFRTYVFDGVLRMGKFNNQKGEFQKRSNLTTVPFPELNRGALSQVYSWLKKSRLGEEVRDGQGKVILDEKTGEPLLDFTIENIFNNPEQETAFQQALKSGDFSKLYVHAIRKTQEGMVTPEQKTEHRGSWKRYSQGSDPRKLYEDLQGFGLDWCTATGYETATTHVRGGDFYVYYTRDENGNDIVPRVAIRMEQGKVAEVRGISSQQDIEPVMVDIAAGQLQKLPGGETYVKKATDMKQLTAIAKKTAADPEAPLTPEEMVFLYEMDKFIEGFGYRDDPRINKIRRTRQDLDRVTLEQMLPITIQELYPVAMAAYNIIATRLGCDRESLTERNLLLKAKQREWEANGTYAYMAEQIQANGGRFLPILVPNIEVSERQIFALANAFNKDTPLENSYGEGWHTGREWSGPTSDKAVRLVLIPTHVGRSDTYPTTAKQRLALENLQRRLPDLNARVPSLLEAITYWYALRLSGHGNEGLPYKTTINHFDLAGKPIARMPVVPESHLSYDGQPHIFESLESFGGSTRLAIG